MGKSIYNILLTKLLENESQTTVKSIIDLLIYPTYALKFNSSQNRALLHNEQDFFFLYAEHLNKIIDLSLMQIS